MSDMAMISGLAVMTAMPAVAATTATTATTAKAAMSAMSATTAMSAATAVPAMTVVAATALAWLLTYTLHSTLLLATAWSVTRRLGRRSLVLQETLWRGALIGGLVTASMQLAFAQIGHAPIAGGWILAPGTTAAARSAVTAPAQSRSVAPLGPFAALTGNPANGDPRARATAAGVATTAAAATTAGVATTAAAATTQAVPPAAALTPATPASLASQATPATTGGGTASRARQVPAPSLGAVSSGSSVGKVSAAAARSAAVWPAGKVAAAAARSAAVWPAGGILAVWLVAAFLLSAAYLRSYYLLRRRLRYRPRVVGGDVLARLAGLMGEAGIAHPVRLTCTWRLRVPVALGGQAAEICVPPRALFQLSDEQQDALLAHELAHLARRDSAWLMITQLMATLFFFQPFNWLAKRRLRELSELVCDQWAVAQTGRPLSLAGCLAEVAAWSFGPRRQARLPVPGMADRPSQLAYRIRRLLDGTPLEGRAPVGRAILWSTAGVLAVFALVAPGISAGSTAAEPPAETVPALAPALPAAPAPETAAARPMAMAPTQGSEVGPTSSPGSLVPAGGLRRLPQAAAITAITGVTAKAVSANAGAAASAVPRARAGALQARASWASMQPATSRPEAAIAVTRLAPIPGPEAPLSSPQNLVIITGSRALLASPHEAPIIGPDRPMASLHRLEIVGSGVSSLSPRAVMMIAAMAQPAARPAPEAPEAASAPAAATAPDSSVLLGPDDAAPAAPGLDREHSDATSDPAAERVRIADAAARLAALDKVANLSQEQLAAISKAVDHVSKEINVRLQKELGDLDHRIASIHGNLAPMAGLSAKELAHLDADLAEITAHVHFSPEDMSHLDAELNKLAAEAPRLSRQEIQRIEKDVQREMHNHPNGGLTPAEIDRLKADAMRAIEESRAALAQALPPAERDRILADARRLATQAKPDKAQAEILRHLERERQDLARLLEKQRADLESMRRDIERESAAYRDLARRESASHRIRPHSTPAAPGTPAAPSSSAAPKSAPAPAQTPPAAAPPAPESSAPPPSAPSR